MDFRRLVEDHRGRFEELTSSIPGYEGYKKRELRREADKLLRNKIVSELDIQRRRLGEAQRGLVSAGLIEYTDDMERAIMKLQVLSDRIRTATYGYRGLFDAVKVKEDQLDALHDFDYGLLAGIPEIAEAVDKVSNAVQSRTDILPAINELVNRAIALDELFSKRQEAIFESGQDVG